MNFFDHVAVTLGFFVAQTKLMMLRGQHILNIHRAYAESAWHFLGFKVFAESTIYGLLVHPKTIVFGRTYVLRMMFFFIRREISEMRGPTGAKFCTMVSTRPNFIMPVQN